MNIPLRAFILCVALTQPGRAAIFTLEPEADARIINIAGAGYREANYANDFLSVYTQPANAQRTLMRFSFDGVPLSPGDRVVSASLSVVVSTGYGTSQGRSTEIYRVTRSWTETGLSWLAAEASQPWKEEGGEYVGRSGFRDLSPYAVNSETALNGQRISWDLTALVDEWVEGAAPNHGLLMRSQNGNGMTFPSSEGAVDVRPQLTIVTGPGVPRLRVERSGESQIKLSWRGANVAVLEENTSASPLNWTAVANVTPAIANGRTEVLLPAPSSAHFFRLRSP